MSWPHTCICRFVAFCDEVVFSLTRISSYTKRTYIAIVTLSNLLKSEIYIYNRMFHILVNAFIIPIYEQISKERMLLLNIVIILLSYGFGCINGAYLVGQYLGVGDIRSFGSTNAGARNAGRVLGKGAFIGTVVIDALKTVIPLLAAELIFNVNHVTIAWMALALLMGHIWPVHMQFRGGKGVVVYLATALVMVPIALLPTAVMLLIGLAFKRSFSIAGFAGMLMIPLYLLIRAEWFQAGLFLILLCIVAVAHRWGRH